MTRTILITLSVLTGLASWAQPVTTVRTIAELRARKIVNESEVVRVLGYHAPGDSGEPWDVKWYPSDSTATNRGSVYAGATAGGRYKALGVLAPEVDLARFGAVGDGTTDDTAAINEACTFVARFRANKAPGSPVLRIRPTEAGYLITDTIKFRSSVRAAGAMFLYRGPTNGIPVQVGPDDADGYGLNAMEFYLPDVLGPTAGTHAANYGVKVQNLKGCKIHLGHIQHVGTGLYLRGGPYGTTLSETHGGIIENMRRGVRISSETGTYVTAFAINDLKINNFSSTDGVSSDWAPGAATGFEMYSVEGDVGGSINGLTINGGSWEGFPSQRVVAITNASGILIKGVRLEHHFGDFPSVDWRSMYMQVHADVSGLGIDNRFTDPNQESGLYGITVRETGYAAGNSGGDTRASVRRSRDQGFYRSGFVGESSAAINDQFGGLTLYPYMAWPLNPVLNYTNWQVSITPLVSRWKVASDRYARLEILMNGSETLYNGADFNPIWMRQIDGQMNWYNGTTRTLSLGYDGLYGTNGIRFGTGPNNESALRIDASTTPGQTRLLVRDVTTGEEIRVNHDAASRLFHSGAAPTSLLRTNSSTSSGGLELTDRPTNALTGFYLSQTMKGPKAQAGFVTTGINTNGVDYSVMAFGQFPDDYENTIMRGALGFYGSWTAGSSVSNFVAALGPTNGTFNFKAGPSGTQLLKVDRPTAPKHSSLTVYNATSGTEDRILIDPITGFLYVGDPISGTGSPEGVISGGKGRIYVQTDGAGSYTLWVHESGSGNTGWVSK